MNKKELIVKLLCTFHYVDIIRFVQERLKKGTDEEKELLLEHLYNSKILKKMDYNFLEDIYDGNSNIRLKFLVLKLISNINSDLFLNIFKRDYMDKTVTEENINIILEVINQKELVPFIIKNLENVSLYMKAMMMERLSGFYSDELKEIFVNEFKDGSELVQLAIIRGIGQEKYFEFLVSKVFSGNPTIEIACLSKFSSMLASDSVRIKIKKAILTIINEKLNSNDEIVQIAAIKSIVFFDTKIFQKLVGLWNSLHPFYFPVLKDTLLNLLIVDSDHTGRKLVFEKIAQFKIQNFTNFIYGLKNKELTLFLFQKFRRVEDFEEFESQLKIFIRDNKLFIDQRFVISFFKDLKDNEIQYFRLLLEKIFMREYTPFRFRDVDVKIISEYLSIFGMLSIPYSEHFQYISFDYIKIAILRFISKNDDNYSYLIECAKYKSEEVKEAAVFGLGEYENSTNFLIGIYKNSSDYQRVNIVKSLSLGKNILRKQFFLSELMKENINKNLKDELTENLITYADDNEVLSYTDFILKSDNASIREKIICMQIKIHAGRFEDIMYYNILEELLEDCSKENFLLLCETIRFITSTKVIDMFLVLVEKFPDYTSLIYKFLYYYNNVEASKKILLFY